MKWLNIALYRLQQERIRMFLYALGFRYLCVSGCNIHSNDGVSSLQLSPLASSLVAIASTNESMMKMKLMKTVKKLGV